MLFCCQHTAASLATSVLTHVMSSWHLPGQLELQTAALINQQLASLQPATDPEDDMTQEAPSVRVCLQMQQARTHACTCCIATSLLEVLGSQYACNSHLQQQG